MKKIIISLVFLLFFTLAGYSQNIDKLISEQPNAIVQTELKDTYFDPNKAY